MSLLDLPRAARPFVAFPALLRANGFAVAPEQTTAFLPAVGLLGPRSIEDVRRAAHATLAPPPERRADFDVLFGFPLPRARPRPAMRRRRRAETRSRSGTRAAATRSRSTPTRRTRPAQAATVAEVLSARRLARATDDGEALRRFARAAPALLPRRRGYRRLRARRGAASICGAACARPSATTAR